MANSSNHKKLPVGRIEQILLIGCGGTGSILAEHLGRMIAGFKLTCRLILADGDTVERSNVWRQNFAAHEVGQNKASALGLRMAGRYGIAVEAVGEYIDAAWFERHEFVNTLIITAIDSNFGRKAIAGSKHSLWLDAGNEKTFGQAVIGTTHDKAVLRKVYWNWTREKGYAAALPNIAAINPAILAARKARKRAGCGQTPFAEQGFGINGMAALAASVLARQAVVDGVVLTAAIYFDTDTGRMTPRLIDKDLYRPWMRKETSN